ncbi:MAG: hypothetical protein H8E76_02455 [Helicobacteraceae bacterium]|nr:hypothetical protein [Candidatus Sulfurimonas ponti]MBL6973849.1 hypothetical protein [Sulfurimonas sp.]
MEATIIDKQNELIMWIDKIGLTQKYFAGLYAQHIYHNPQEGEIQSFYEKYRGHMKRSTTKISVIDRYLNFLYTLDEFKDVGYIKPQFHYEDSFDDSFNKRMKKISKDITDKILDK